MRHRILIVLIIVIVIVGLFWWDQTHAARGASLDSTEATVTADAQVSAEPQAAIQPQVPVRPGGLHGFGTDPSRHVLPETAIDTGVIPNLVIDPNASPQEPLPYFQIARDTYLLYGNIAEVDQYNRGFNGNAGFVITEQGVVVIDALGTPKLGERLIHTIRTVTGQPIKYLILTHNHPDHAYGAMAFRQLGGVTIIAHEGVLHYLDSPALERSVAFRRSFIGPDMADFVAVKPDVLIDVPVFAKETITLGNKRFDIYNVGAHHSHGDLIVHQVEDGILWVADLAFNNRTTFMGDGSSEQALAALRWLEENPAFKHITLMVPGHGSAQTPPFPMVAKTQAYIQELREMMNKAVADGLSLQEAVEKCELPQWQDVRLYGLNQRPNCNFVYREMEQAFFEGL